MYHKLNSELLEILRAIWRFDDSQIAYSEMIRKRRISSEKSTKNPGMVAVRYIGNIRNAYTHSLAVIGPGQFGHLTVDTQLI